MRPVILWGIFVVKLQLDRTACCVVPVSFEEALYET